MQFDKEYKSEVQNNLKELMGYLMQLEDTVNSSVEPEKQNKIDTAFNLALQLRQTIRSIQ